MKTQRKAIELLRNSGVCLFIFSASAGIAASAPAQTAQPEKLEVRAQIQTNAEGATAEVTVTLRDAQNQPVAADNRGVRVDLETRLQSGHQLTNLVINGHESSVRCSVPLQEGGVLELRATQPDVRMRPGSLFVKVKPFTRPGGQVANYTPYSAGSTRSASAPNTHLGTEAAKIGDTATAIGDAVHSVKSTAESFIHIFGHGPVAAGFLAGAIDRTYLADGKDGAVVQVFLGQAVKARTEIALSSTGGKLTPETIVIEKNQDSGEATLTSDQTGSVTVKVVDTGKTKGLPTNQLSFQFVPPIKKVFVTASQPKISLFETADIIIQFQAADGKSIAPDVQQKATLRIAHGRGALDKTELIVPANELDARTRFTPTLSGKMTLVASVEHLSDAPCEVEVTLPVLLMGLTVFGGALGGLLAAFQNGLPAAVSNGPLRRRLQALPWWRMVIGSVTGFVLYWAIMFLSFSALPKALALNPASAVVCALLGGWLGLSVFSLVLRALRISKGPEGPDGPSAPAGRRPLAEARG
jgi:hypothetical protein